MFTEYDRWQQAAEIRRYVIVQVGSILDGRMTVADVPATYRAAVQAALDAIAADVTEASDTFPLGWTS